MPEPRDIVRTVTRCLAAASLLAGAAAMAEEPQVSVTHDAARDATQVHASMTMPAPPMAVFAVLSECERAVTIVPNLVSCHVVQRDPAGHWDIRATEFKLMLLVTIHAQTRNTYEPGKRIAFRLVGGDMRISEGEWRLTPAPNGGTHVDYRATFAINIPAPRFMIDQAAKDDIPTLMRNVERASSARVAHCGATAARC
ncbi:MAG: hypothetical protein OJF62_003299 [Pseudolabrys sp.]|jgi:ribosome-associated toxin RatA of RatAB toxin-antitoxin module|nr:hypothetical protein [Pseudolabrys sp.]